MSAFSQALRKAREESGHASSRAFYNSLGGQRFFGCTYRHLLNLESGRTAPSAKLMERILIALGLHGNRDRALKFIRAYLETVTGSKEVVRFIEDNLRTPSARVEGAKEPLVDAMARLNRQHRKDLTRKQAETILSSEEVYWIFNMLSHDASTWSVDALAERSGYSTKAVESALKSLKGVKLIKKDGKKGWLCPFVGKVFQFPDDKLVTKGNKTMLGYHAAMAKKQGDTLLRYHFFSRGSEGELRQYFPYLVKGVQGADVCTATRPEEDSVFFEVETTVRRLMSF